MTAQHLDGHKLPVYLGGDLPNELKSKIKYPIEALQQRIQGDVVFSIQMSAEGLIEAADIVSTPSPILANSGRKGMDQLENNWHPATMEGVPTAGVYLLILRYRQFVDQGPPQFQKRASKFYSKGKLSKALKAYDAAVKDNPYDFRLFKARANIHQLLGNIEEAKADLDEAMTKSHQILAVVDLFAMGRTKITQIRQH